MFKSLSRFCSVAPSNEEDNKPYSFCYTEIMPSQKLIIIRGYPGAGKSTIGRQLEMRQVGKFIDHNAILTFVASIAGDDDGIYDQIADLEIAICKKLLRLGHTVIVARGFSNLDDIATYEDIAKELDVITIIFRLEVSLEELKIRVKSPERKLDYNPTIDENNLKSWIRKKSLQNHAMEKIINNEKYLDEVINEIIDKIGS